MAFVRKAFYFGKGGDGRRQGKALLLLALFPAFVPASAGVLAPALRALLKNGIPPRAAGRVPRSPFAPRIDDAGRVQVVIHPLHPRGPLPPTSVLQALGARHVRRSAPMDVVQLWVPVRELPALASLEDVGYVGLPAYAVVKTGAVRPPNMAAQGRAVKALPARGGTGSLGLGALVFLSVPVALRRRNPFRFASERSGAYAAHRHSEVRARALFPSSQPQPEPEAFVP